MVYAAFIFKKGCSIEDSLVVMERKKVYKMDDMRWASI